MLSAIHSVYGLELGSENGCCGCGNLGGGRVDEIYRPYIDGEKELAEINAEYAASRGLVK